jgi:TonB-linked SusC/RagA family outer membrane protein
MDSKNSKAEINRKVRKKHGMFSICVTFLLFFPLLTNAQQPTISLSVKNSSFQSIFEKIESATPYRFTYKDGILPVGKTFTITEEDKPIELFLNQLLTPVGLTFKRTGNTFAILKQDKSTVPISGTLTDANGERIIGASIAEKGTTNGTTTDVNGTFSLTVAENAVLQISYIGYVAREIAVGNQTDLNITLQEDLQYLEEVVVVGYGTQSKRYITGSVAKVDLSNVGNSANTNINQVLRGRVAGVQFIDNTRPGQNGSILIRGQRSIKASNDPLVVVDGIIYNGNFLDINPNDVQEMNILKDASATAIYGSRAANGVILITTKKGDSDKPLIRFSASTGLQNWSYTPDVLNPQQYIQKTLDYRAQNGQDADPAKIESYLSGPEAENYRNGITINPYDIISQQGSIQNYDVSISGRTPNTNYFISGLWSDERGLVVNDNAKRIALRFNFESKITDWLRTGITSQFARRDLSGVRADFAGIHRLSPYAKLYMDEEKTKYKLYPVDDSIIPNPLFETNLQSREEINYNLLANFYAIVSIPFIKGLSYRLNYSPNYRWGHNYYLSPIYTEQGLNRTGTVEKYNGSQVEWTMENIVDYSRTFGKHHIAATLLYGANEYNGENTTATGRNLYNDANGWNNLGIAQQQSVASSASAYSSISMMARLNYRFNDRYLLTLTARRDGYSGFGVNNKYGDFPSAALSWIVSEEPFIKNIPVIDLLKFRLSYGKTGNQAISPYQSLDRTGTTYYVYGDGGSTAVGTYPSGMANANLAWESTTATNFAVDFEVLKSRLGGTVELYNLETTNLLMDQSLPSMTGFASVVANVGETNNKGIEITLNSVNISTPKFEWHTDLVFSTNKNKIVHLTRMDADGDGKEDDNIANRWFIGQPVRVAYDYVFEGIYQDGDTDIPAGWKPGFVRVKTANENGVPTPDDRIIIGQLDPKYRWGLNNTFRYDNLTFSVFINSMQGWIAPFEIVPYYPGRPLNFYDTGYWTAENKSNTRPSLVYTNPLGQGFCISRDFIRIQDVSLSYSFKNEFLNPLKINSLSAFFSIKNLYTFTDWLGYDPENGSQAGGFPTPRTFMAGINISF